MLFNRNKKKINKGGIRINFLSDASVRGFQKTSKKEKGSSRGFFGGSSKKIEKKQKMIKERIDIKKPNFIQKESVFSKPSLLSGEKKPGDKKPIDNKNKKSMWSGLFGAPKKKENDPHKDKIKSIIKNIKNEESGDIKKDSLLIKKKKEAIHPELIKKEPDKPARPPETNASLRAGSAMRSVAGEKPETKKPVDLKRKKSMWSGLFDGGKKVDKKDKKPIEKKLAHIPKKVELKKPVDNKKKKSMWFSFFERGKKVDKKKVNLPTQEKGGDLLANKKPGISKADLPKINSKQTELKKDGIKAVKEKLRVAGKGRDFSVPEKKDKPAPNTSRNNADGKPFWKSLFNQGKKQKKKEKTIEEIKEEIKEEEDKKKIPFFESLFSKKTKLKKQPSAKNGKEQPIIETNNLSVTYNLGKTNELHALKNANVKIYTGEYVIMFGPSGCGKSTLLFALTGLQTPTKGDVFVDGLELSKLDQRSRKMVDFHRKKIGIIFQAFHLIPSLNVFKNVGLPSIFTGESSGKRNKRIQDLLDRFSIAGQAKKLPSQLSGGQKQRVAIARSLVNDPKILFADEPVGNLDSASADTVLNILKELNEKEGRTIILVTHDSRHLNFANRVFHIKDGLIVREQVNKDIRPSSVKVEEEKKRPEISEELDLLLRTYSGLSSAQLGGMLIPYKAKQLVQDVLVGMSSEQVKNIEKIVEEYLMNVHTGDYKMIERTLDQSLDEGGAGLDSRTAGNLTEKIEGVLEEVKNIDKQAGGTPQEYKVSEKSDKVQHLRRFLLEKYNVHIKNEESLKRFDEVIELRLQNKLDSYRLRKTLDKSLKKGGVGLDGRNAKKLAKEMELIMLLRFK